MRIYCSVVDKIDPHMILHITFHDIGETFIGDLPYPVKSENPELKKSLDFMEQKSHYLQLDYWDAFKAVLLTDADRKLFKDIELIEMAEFGMGQMCMGNSHGLIIADRCLRKVYQNEPCARLVQYVIKRINLFFKQYKNPLRSESLGEWWSVIKWEELLTHGFKLEETDGSE
jgi:5'-deoxynucleotidase YfbR-like HD superfamily hydrolase